MARRQTTYTIEGGRDNGKTFLLTEMPADQAEQFAWKVACAAFNGGMGIPYDLLKSGWAGLAHIGPGLLTAIPYDALKPLLDDMLQCVQIIPEPSRPGTTRPFDYADIEEATTLLALRAEVFKLHVNFSDAAESSTSA